MTASFRTSGMSCGLTGIFCSTPLKMAIWSPSAVWTVVNRDASSAFGCGSTAGSGRKRNEPITVVTTATGTVIAHVTSNAADRNNRRKRLRMGPTASRARQHAKSRCEESYNSRLRRHFARGAPIVTGVRPPSVDALARSLAETGLPHPLLVDAAREAIAAGDPDSAAERANDIARALLQPV